MGTTKHEKLSRDGVTHESHSRSKIVLILALFYVLVKLCAFWLFFVLVICRLWSKLVLVFVRPLNTVDKQTQHISMICLAICNLCSKVVLVLILVFCALDL